MLDPTEGVPHSRVGKPFLRRNLAKDVDVDAILSDDRQEIRVDVSTYRIIFTYNGVPGRPFVYEKKRSRNEMAFAEDALAKEKVKRDQKMRERFVNNTRWMKALSSEEIGRRDQAWQMGLEDGLWKMEGGLTAGEPVDGTSGGAGGGGGSDAMAVDTAI